MEEEDDEEEEEPVAVEEPEELVLLTLKLLLGKEMWVWKVDVRLAILDCSRACSFSLMTDHSENWFERTG